MSYSSRIWLLDCGRLLPMFWSNLLPRYLLWVPSHYGHSGDQSILNVGTYVPTRLRVYGITSHNFVIFVITSMRTLNITIPSLYKSKYFHQYCNVWFKLVLIFNPLNAELNPICYMLALLGAHHFLHVSRIRVKSLTLRLLMLYIYIHGAPILDVSRSHTTMHHSR